MVVGYVRLKLKMNIVWNEIKEGKTLKGFSLEIMCDLVEKKTNVLDEIEEYIDEILG